MSRYEVTKSVEVRKLHPRSLVPLSEPPVTLPFGAILENLREDRDLFKFDYLGQPHQGLQDVLRPAIRPLGSSAREKGSEKAAKANQSSRDREVASDPPSSSGAGVDDPILKWEVLRTSEGRLLRAKVPGGWLISLSAGSSLAFYPDASHAWDGKSLD